MGWNGRTVLVLGALGAVAYAVLAGPAGAGAWAGVPYCAVGLFSVVATVVGIRRHRPRHAAAWWCIALSHAVWVVADAGSYVLTARGADTFPTPADAGYVAGYVPLLVGVALMVRRRRSDGQLGGLVDGAVVATGLGLIGWLVFVGPVLAQRGEGELSRLTSGVYVGADVLLVALAAHLVACSVHLTRGSWLVLAAITFPLAGDSTYVWGSSLSTGVVTVLSTGWLLSSAAWAAAALHPSMAALSDSEAPAASGMTPRRTGVLLVAVLLAPATLAALQVLDLEADWAVAAACALMSVLVVCRLAMALRVASTSLAAREEMREALQHQATHDPLTGLANRSASTDHLTRALLAARDGGAPVGLLFVDLDGFKAVNDTHGHRAGDQVLREVAARLTGAVRDGDVAGRLGGDEFVVVLTSLEDVGDLHTVAQRVVDGVAEPITTDGRVVSVGASVGATVGDAGADPSSLLHEADVAVYRAKALGRGRVVLFDHALRAADVERASLESGLRAAWPVDGLALDLSPVVSTAPPDPAAGPTPAPPVALTGQLRWHRAGAPDADHHALVGAAEKVGRTGDLGRWALAEGLRQQGAAGPAAPPVWVPLQVGHVVVPQVVRDVTSALEARGAAPRDLAVRTWGPWALGAPASSRYLRELRSLGVGVVLEGLTAQQTGLGELEALPATALLLRSAELPGAAVLTPFVLCARSSGLEVVLDGPVRDDLADAAQALGLLAVAPTGGLRRR